MVTVASHAAPIGTVNVSPTTGRASSTGTGSILSPHAAQSITATTTTRRIPGRYYDSGGTQTQDPPDVMNSTPPRAEHVDGSEVVQYEPGL